MIMRYLKKMVLLPLVVFWVIVYLKYEPFRSHFWLTMVCAVLSVPVVLVVSALIAHVFRGKGERPT